MVNRRVKYASGMAANYISRAAAVKKLQLSLKDFHRLCILKGIYPRDPAHKKIANKGSTQNKVFYHARDIQYLANEPLINKFREYKTYMKKLIRAKNKREKNKATTLQVQKPEFKLDHLVRERYPTFSLALRDLDDCLNLLFAFALLPKSKAVKSTVIDDCRRLTAEFLHYVIQAQCLTKVFVSIKGTYFQAQIMGEKVTWIMGHQRSVGKTQDVDFATLANFVDFYTTALSFINFRLYKSIGLLYPPKLARSKNTNSEGDVEELYSLAHELQASADSMPSAEAFTDALDDEGDIAEKMKEMMKLKTLFKGCKFFLNREVPQDILTLIIRNCGGIVSWDGCPGGKYSSSYDGITHHVIDRPLHDSFSMNRTYIQPQWVFDSFNYRKLLPVNKYVPGATLPPHLSPFVLESSGDYIPPERLEMLRELGKEIPVQKENAPVSKNKTKATKKPEKREKVLIKEGKVFNENQQQLMNVAGHTKKLKEMMIPKRYKNAYKKIQFGIKRKAKETRALEEKRRKKDAASAVE
jgi:pescadillo protein